MDQGEFKKLFTNVIQAGLEELENRIVESEDKLEARSKLSDDERLILYLSRKISKQWRQIEELEDACMGLRAQIAKDPPSAPPLPPLSSLSLKEPMTDLVIVMEGGVIQDIVSSDPVAFEDIDILVLDYDVDGVEPSKLVRVKQGEGGHENAYITSRSVSHSSIVIDSVDSKNI